MKLTFPDGETLADLGTYVARARSLEEDGAIRLQAVGGVLAAWVCVVPGQGLTGSGTVLGLRTMVLAGAHDLDVTVALAAMGDRFARRSTNGEAGTTLQVPPAEVSPRWAGVLPPRGGWEPVGTVRTADLLTAAVGMLRARVWSQEVLDAAGAPTGAPAGAGLAARVLGFARAADGRSATVHRQGAWTRVSLPSGYVLSRAASGAP